MKRPYKSLAAATEAAIASQKRLGLYELATWDLVNGKVQWLKTSWKQDGETTSVKLGITRLKSCAIAILRFHTKGATPDVSVHYLEELVARVRENSRLLGYDEAYQAQDRLLTQALEIQSELMRQERLARPMAEGSTG